MFDRTLISIIVPVYKVEYWLPKCIKSLLSQTYENLEIILVDDGSPDKSGEICEKFAKKDHRIKVIHKENGGVSAARNVGIDLARGGYICFVDSDDWLPKQSIETLYREFEKNSIQVAIGNLFLLGKYNRTIKVVKKERIISFDNETTLFEDLYEEDSLSGVTGKMFSTEFIRNNNIRFKTGMKFGEDVLFLLECFRHCSAISLIEKNVYYYNRLVLESAITRHYPELNDWMVLLSEARQTLSSQKGFQYQNRNLYVAKNAFIEFEYIINSTYFQKTEKLDAIIIFEKAYNSLKPFFYIDLLKENTYEYYLYKNYVEKYCEIGDFLGLYQAVNKKFCFEKKKFGYKIKQEIIKNCLHFKRVLHKIF